MDDGWTNVDICGLLGGNLLRVLDSTQSAQPDRQVRHRPAKVLGVIGNAGKATATMVADGNTLTAWEPTDLKTGDVASIRLTVAGPGVNRVAITSAGPDKSGGDFGVLVQGFCDGRLVVGPVPLDVGSSVRPYRADLSALSDCSIPTVEVSFPPGEAPNKAFRLSEVTCEVSAGNDPVNSTLEYESDSVQCIKNQ
jgi:hypothetical protein